MSRLNYWKIMTRRKPMPPQEEDSKFGRVFGTFDLTALGVSATLGVGVYVLAGHVAKLEAGPSVILSFAIAAAVSFLAGLCYSEFSSRVPNSGSAYVFTYVAIGEFVAFVIGWNLLLEYIIGSASIAKGLSLYIDSLVNDTMKNSFRSIAPIAFTGSGFLSNYFDFFAFSCPLLLGLALAFGLRKSAGMNNIFCILNLGVVLYVVIVVLLNADIRNWQIDPNLVTSEYRNATGKGGFFPFGFSGTIKGAATCFFGFVGFDCIATTGEEVKSPRKTVPRAILFSLMIIFLAYFGVSLLTLMWPYYLLDIDAPLPHAFEEIGWITSKWIVTIGGIIGLFASLFGAMFPQPRILYAMSLDGLIFKGFGSISTRFKTPVVGTLCAAALTSAFAGLFDLAALVNMLSIGVLLAYTVVAISIIVLRFSTPVEQQTRTDRYIETSNLLRPGYNVTTKGFFMQLVRFNSCREPNTISMTVVGVLISCYCVVSLLISIQISYGWEALENGDTWALVITSILAALLIIFCLLISIQPRQTFAVNRTKPFMVPFVPFLPGISIFVNIYLMLMLDYFTWIRFGIWMIFGLIMYIPCAWYYNNRMNNNETSSSSNIEEDVKATKLSENDVNRKSNEGDVIITHTCENENVITAREKENSSDEYAAMETVINNKLNEDNETHLAIEILDTVLENEEGEREEEEEEEEKIFEKSPPSIKLKEDVPKTVEKLPSSSPMTTENLTLKIIDSSDIQSEINEILERAVEIASQQLENETSDDASETVFQNQKFLTHLSDLISSKSNQNVIQSQTLQRKKSASSEPVTLPTLRHSSSAPDLKELFQSEEIVKVFKNDDDTKKRRNDFMSPPSVYNTELLEKFAAMKKKKNQVEKKLSESSEEEEDDEKNVNKNEFREKLEKLLSAPPTRLTLLRPTPVPLPRTKSTVVRDEREEEKVDKIANDLKPAPRKMKPSQTPATPISATMMKQKEIFNEILKKIKRDD